MACIPHDFPYDRTTELSGGLIRFDDRKQVLKFMHRRCDCRKARTRERPRVDPEMLFAAGYAGCFISALRYTALSIGVDASKASVASSVALKPGSNGAAFKLGVRLEIDLPGIEKETGQKIVNGAHKICPYSAAVRDNIDVDLALK